MSIATIILAAGGSTRLGGTPKQLLAQQGQTLIEQITNSALSLNVGPVFVILGANEEQIRPQLTNLPVRILLNPNWQEGLASSLRVGLNAISEQPAEAFLVLLTDQPHVTSTLLQELINTRQQAHRGIVACQYGESDHVGVPALFNIGYKAEFMKLSGDVGARKLIQQHTDDCATIRFPLAAIDLDTWQDVEAWRNTQG